MDDMIVKRLVALRTFGGEVKPTTTSLQVAEYFGKEHYNVIRDIKDVISKCSESFNALNFEAVEYTDSKGEKRPMYLLTRDGFTIVAMGYTGAKAMQFKEQYIAAFNAMEHQLITGRSVSYQLNDRIAAARIIFEAAKLQDNQLALALDKVYRSNTGQSALDEAGVALVSPKNELALTPTQIGEQCNPVLTPRVINLLLQDAGYQRRIGKNWEPCDKAAGMYELLDVNKSHSDGTPIKQLKWYSSIIPVVRRLAGQIEEK